MGGGHQIPDMFNNQLHCIDFKVNNKIRPDCLIGYATKDLPPDLFCTPPEEKNGGAAGNNSRVSGQKLK